MKFNKLIFQKEIKLELRNNISLYLITPTLISLLILLPLLSQNKFFINNELFLILELLFLLIFSTLFSIRRNFDFKKIKREINFAQYSFQNYFYSKLLAEIIIFFPQVLFFIIIFSGLTNSTINTNLFSVIASIFLFVLNTSISNLYFQLFTNFSNNFVQMVLLLPIYIGFIMIISPIWLGITPQLTTIYFMLLTGTTLLNIAFTNYFVLKK